MSGMSDDARRYLAAEYLSNLVDADDDDRGVIFRTEETRQQALVMLSTTLRNLRGVLTPADRADMAYEAAVTANDIVQQINMAEDDHDRWGHLMSIGFTICDALTLREEDVPVSLCYIPSGVDYDEQMREDFDNLDAEEAESKYPDHGTLYFAWGLGLGEGMGSIDADDLREYLTGPWQAAYDALEAAGEDY